MSFSRRQFLQTSALGTTALVLGGATPTTSATPRRLVVLRVDGGWDVTYSIAPRLSDAYVDGPDVDMDPKISRDVEEIRSFDGVDIMVNDFKRPAVTAYFEKWMPQTAIVHGISTGAIAHDSCRARVLTGTESNMNPDFASMVGSVYGANLPLGAIDLCGCAYTGDLAASSGQVGAHSQILSLLDRTRVFPAESGSGIVYPQFVPAESDASAVREWLRGRNERYAQLRSAGDAHNGQLLADLDQALTRAERIHTESQSLLDQLTLGVGLGLADSGVLASTLLAQDFCAAAVIDSRVEWDTHSFNSVQHDSHQSLFIGLSALMDALDANGLLADTLVLVVSEMTRMPKLNDELGKDHWPHASVMLIGAGVVGGRVYGGYSETMESMPMDLATGDVGGTTRLGYANFAAGVLHAMGIDPGGWFPKVTPFTGAFRT